MIMGEEPLALPYNNRQLRNLNTRMASVVFDSLIRRVQLGLTQKYSNSLFFYLSKQVSQHIRTRTISKEVALLRDFSYWDYEQEFLKRFYTNKESPQRIHLLEDYFRHTRMLPEEMPRILPFRELLFKRIKRRIKLKKKLQEHPSGRPSCSKDQLYLVELPSNELAEQIFRSQNIDEVSFDSEAYDIYEGYESEDRPKEEGDQHLTALLSSIPTLGLLREDEEDDEDVSYAGLNHLVLDFATVVKRPLLELNLSVKPHNKVYYEQPIESREQCSPRESFAAELMPSKQHFTNQFDLLSKQKSPAASEKKVYLVKGLKQRENFESIRGEAYAYQEYYNRRKQKEDQNLQQEQRRDHRKMKQVSGRAPGSRLDDLREKLKSLESRSSSLSQRISTLMTERETKKKVDYADLMARVKGVASNAAAAANTNSKASLRSPPPLRTRHNAEYGRGQSTGFGMPLGQQYVTRAGKQRSRDMAQALDIYPDD